MSGGDGRSPAGAGTAAEGTLDRETLNEIIQRIVDVAQPEKIVLFGSAARGGMGPHSDVDLLIVKARVDALDVTFQIYGNLHGVTPRSWFPLKTWSATRKATRWSSIPLWKKGKRCMKPPRAVPAR